MFILHIYEVLFDCPTHETSLNTIHRISIPRMLACVQPIKDGPSFSTGQPQPHALAHGTSIYNTQNDLLLHKVLRFYHENDGENMDKMLAVINGTTNISLRIMDWFVTNYSKKHYTVYDLVGEGNAAAAATRPKRFKVYVDYKLKLRAYSKKRLDPFCRWDRIKMPFGDESFSIETTIGQLNFFCIFDENATGYIWDRCCHQPDQLPKVP